MFSSLQSSEKIDNKPLLRALSGKPSSIPPVWLMRQAGRYLPEYMQIRNNKKDFLDLCYSPKDAAEVTLQPLRRFPLDAAIIFSDILVIQDALGVDLKFVKGKGPVLKAITDSDLSSLHYDAQKLSPVYEAIDLVKSNLEKDKALLGFSGAPWTLATYMVEGGGK